MGEKLEKGGKGEEGRGRREEKKLFNEGINLYSLAIKLRKGPN